MPRTRTLLGLDAVVAIDVPTHVERDDRRRRADPTPELLPGIMKGTSARVLGLTPSPEGTS